MDPERARATRRHASRIGLALFLYLLLTNLVQTVLVLLLRKLAPALLEQDWSLIALTALPMYLVAFPVFLRLLPPAPAERPAQTALPFGELLTWLLMCFGVMYPANLLGNGLNALVGRLLGAGAVEPLTDAALGSELGVYILYAGILGPVLEELTFRKLLIDRLRPIDERLAVGFSALCFALFHGNLTQFAYALLLGLLLGRVYLRSGRLLYSAGLHMLINLFGGVISALLLRRLDPALLTPSGMADPAVLMENLPALAALGLFGLLVLGLTIAGICLLISRRALLRMPEPRLNRRSRFRLGYCTGGFALYLLLCLSLFAAAYFV